MKIIILLLAIFLSFNKSINAQCNLSNERKQEIIDSLNSTNYWHRSDALEIIWNCKIIEAKEIIENRFWEIGPEYMVLNTLYDLGSDLTYQFAIAYYDSMQYEIDQLDLVNDPDSINWEVKRGYLELQVDAIEVLFKLNDFSKAYKVIELLDSYPEEPKNSSALSALAYMISGTPQYRERAIMEFENAVQSDAYSSWNRLNFLFILRENLGQETFPIAYNIFLQDTDQTVRRIVLGMLPSYTNENIPGLLKERLLLESDQSIAGSIIGTLIYHYGTPSNYNFIKEFAQSNPDPEFKHDILVSLKLFEPYKPDTISQVDLIRMLDTLQSFSQQCLSFNWIDSLLQTEINANIQVAKTFLSNGDSLGCAREIKAVSEKIDFEYKDTLNTTPEFVTLEGWQFLYNISQYILDRLPEPQANPNLLVNLKNSLGNQIEASN
ncbi:MAG: hypothetical protein HUU44_06490, partial [Ignavibacteriaceae bacterium]|nr:hypothetical protein [Ignavibacteriaceae bacterium]